MDRDRMLAALCDASVVDEATYFNDDKVAHGRAILNNLEESGYTVVVLEDARNEAVRRYEAQRREEALAYLAGRR